MFTVADVRAGCCRSQAMFPGKRAQDLTRDELLSLNRLPCLMCELCGERTRNYGFESEGKRRWCGTCAKTITNAVNINLVKKQPSKRARAATKSAKGPSKAQTRRGEPMSSGIGAPLKPTGEAAAGSSVPGRTPGLGVAGGPRAIKKQAGPGGEPGKLLQLQAASRRRVPTFGAIPMQNSAGCGHPQTPNPRTRAAVTKPAVANGFLRMPPSLALAFKYGCWCCSVFVCMTVFVCDVLCRAILMSFSHFTQTEQGFSSRPTLMCETCGVTTRNYGFEAEGRRRWCGGCAKAVPNAVNINLLKKDQPGARATAKAAAKAEQQSQACVSAQALQQAHQGRGGGRAPAPSGAPRSRAANQTQAAAAAAQAHEAQAQAAAQALLNQQYQQPLPQQQPPQQLQLQQLQQLQHQAKGGLSFLMS